jgi:MFS family permease
MILIAIVPAVLAVVILLTLVQERKKAAAAVKSGLAKTAAITPFSNQFKLYMVILAVFTLGNSSDFFLILDAQHVQTPLLEVVLMLVLFNLTYAAVATPLGVVSDKLGRKKVISVGWLIYGLVYLGFALSSISGSSGYCLRFTVFFTDFARAQPRLLWRIWCRPRDAARPTACITAS